MSQVIIEKLDAIEAAPARILWTAAGDCITRLSCF